MHAISVLCRRNVRHKGYAKLLQHTSATSAQFTCVNSSYRVVNCCPRRYKSDLSVKGIAPVELSAEDVEEIFSDDELHLTCQALRKAGMTSCHTLLASKPYRSVADHISSATTTQLLLATQGSQIQNAALRKACSMLADDILNTDARIVPLLRQAVFATRNGYRHCSGTFVQCLRELQLQLNDSSHAIYALHATFVMALNTVGGTAFIRSLQIKDISALAELLMDIHNTLRVASHPRSKRLEPHHSQRVDETSLRSLRAAIPPVGRHVLERCATVIAASKGSRATVEDALAVVRCIPLAVTVEGSDVEGFRSSVLRMVGDVGAATFPLKGCYDAFLGINAVRSFMSLKAFDDLAAAIASIAQVQPDWQHLSVCMDWLAMLGEPGNVLLRSAEQVGSKISSIIAKIDVSSSQFPSFALRIVRLHADKGIVNPELFAALDTALQQYYACDRIFSREDLLDLPEICWLLHKLRVYSPSLVSVALDCLHRSSANRTSDIWWRASLRQCVFAANARQVHVNLVKQITRQAVSSVERRAPVDLAEELVNGVADTASGRKFIMAALHEFRDHADLLQMLAYANLLQEESPAVATSLRFMETCCQSLKSQQNWAPLLKRAQTDKLARSFILSLAKLTPVRFRALLSEPGSHASLELPLWRFICHVSRDRRLDRERFSLGSDEEYISGFEHSIASCIRKLAAGRGLPMPQSQFFVEELAVFPDLAWSKQRVVVEINGPVHFIPHAATQQTAWLKSRVKRDQPVVLDDRRPDLGFLTTQSTVRTDLRKAALQACGWAVVTVDCFDVWDEYIAVQAPKSTNASSNDKLLAALDQCLSRGLLWKSLK